MNGAFMVIWFLFFFAMTKIDHREHRSICSNFQFEFDVVYHLAAYINSKRTRPRLFSLHTWTNCLVSILVS